RSPGRGPRRPRRERPRRCQMTTEGRLVLTPNMTRVPIGLMAIGLVAAVIGLFINSERVWLNLLVDGFYVLSLGVSGIFFITTQRLSSAKGAAYIRPVA